MDQSKTNQKFAVCTMPCNPDKTLCIGRFPEHVVVKDDDKKNVNIFESNGRVKLTTEVPKF